MPRAFLITHRRYNAIQDGEQRECSPEHKVSLPDTPTSPNAVQPIIKQHYIDDSNSGYASSNDCPDDLYNLTKLAEVSLAAASGQLYHHRHLSTIPIVPQVQDISTQRPMKIITKNTSSSNTPSYAHKLFDRDRDRGNNVGGGRIGNEGSTGSSIGSVSSPEPDVSQHECPDCGKRYSTSSNLARHRQTHRSLADKKARRCPHCDKVYVSMPAYSMHVRTHVQGCRCPYCGKCFSRPWLLQGHIRTHTGEKPFRCSVCQKAFADKSNLRAHVQTHSDTKPHVCGRCGKAFALKSYLYKHEESSCMRGQRSTDQLTTPQKNSLHFQSSSSPPNLIPITNNIQLNNDKPTSTPTPVIVRPDRQFRSTVISPNPERALLSFVERPTALLSATATGHCCIPLTLPNIVQQQNNENGQCDDQPMDFSTSTNNSDKTTGGFTVSRAIIV